MIYFDNAATTKLNPLVSKWIKENMDEMWLNPSSAYAYEIKELIEQARQTILYLIGADEDDHIIFTSGGSEANSMVAQIGKIYTTPIEHDSLLKHPFAYTCVVNEDGFVVKPLAFGKPYGEEDLPDILKGQLDTIISIQLANNEIGTIQDVKSLKNIRPEMLFHTDAVQAIGHIPVNVKELGVDMLSASAHKFGGPKGVGFLYVNKRAYEYLVPIIYGTQEDGKRGSTYNAIPIIAMAKALELACADMRINMEKTADVREFIQRYMDDMPCAHLNGTSDFSRRLPGNLNYRFDGYRGEQLQEFLAEHEIYVSTGSACNTASGNPSHVLKAIGLSDDEADSSLRITVNENNTIEESLQFINILKEGLDLLA